MQQRLEEQQRRTESEREGPGGLRWQQSALVQQWVSHTYMISIITIIITIIINIIVIIPTPLISACSSHSISSLLTPFFPTLTLSGLALFILLRAANRI